MAASSHPPNVWDARKAAAAAARPNDDDPFVVRIFPDRARNPLVTLDDADAWPEVGKTAPKPKHEKKWVDASQHAKMPLPANGSAAHSGHNSASHSRIPSRAGSAQSSPRVSRGRRLPQEEADIAYPSPVYGPDGYFGRHHQYRHASAHSPSSHGGTPPLYPPPPPIPYPGPTAPYPMYYGPFDYGIPSHLYWNASGSESYPYPMQQFNPDRPYVQQSARVPLPPEHSQAVAGYVAAAPLDDKNKRESVTFGSIAAPDSSRSPVPTSPPPPIEEPASFEPQIELMERKTTPFFIGMSATEARSARLRSRTRSSKAHSRASPTGSPSPGAAEVNVIDLTDKEPKWKFGFAEGEISPPIPPKELPSAPETQASSSAVTPLSSISASLPFDAPLSGSLPPTQPGSALANNVALPSDAVTDESDPFKIRNYGYGFGSGTNASSDAAPDTKSLRGEREGSGDRPKSDPRQRRGAFGSYDRGGYNGRRGRGSNGYSRGFNRGPHRGGVHQRLPLPPPQQFQPPILQIGEPVNGYYPPPPHQIPPYPYDAYPPPPPQAFMHIPPSPSAPPMPAPRSQLPFALDSTRCWLLGQLEYYLSPQNLAQDFYLRQQMDSKGWIPISTLASFNRVKALTHDYQCVKDVLAISTVLAVREDWVRMHGWESFVLPNAPQSRIEQDGGSAPEATVEAPTRSDEADRADDAEEEEEEEVVFVIGKEASWSPQAPRYQA
ncbi:hypothetical protein AX14_013481 [Amanita brunnescens Koide BX004]|nr:hypothetical protein AX14_013481 [Amanita brunnescens Koide BX004]